MRAALIFLLGASTAVAQDTTRPGGTGEAWQITQPAQSSLVFARDGSFIGEIGRQMRTSVPLSSLPTHVSQAFIAVEDQRFYQHNGVDMVGVLGAVKDNVMGDRRGASTLPQLLVGMMHPDLIDRREVSGMGGIQRKIREQNAAREMTKRYTKQQVLEAFLNQVDLGHNWFGVEAAARHYFGTSASKLTVAQSASLAALPKSPPAYDPIRRPEANRARRNTIINLMLDQKLITAEVAERAKAEPIVAAPNSGFSVPSSYFVDAVRLEADKAGIPVLNGGYRIYTTLDVPLQQSAVTALVNGTASIEKLAGYKHISQAQAQSQSQAMGSTRLVNTDYLQGAIVVMDPYTGDVRALIGGRNYPLAPFNRATLARRQPGSAIKPIVYAKAIEQGIPVNRIYNDTILEIPLENGQVYMPSNADNKFLGPMTVRQGLSLSRNTISVQMGMETGMDSVAELSKRLGLSLPMMPVPSSAIGASDVLAIELVSAYTAFVNSGQVVAPRMITRIADMHNRTVFSTAASTPRLAMDPRAAFIMRDVMRDAAERGTGSQARRSVPYSVPLAGKTGTTNDNKDVWFLGMTPDLVGAVWLGFDKPKTIMSSAAGGTLAAPIWGQMMAGYYRNRRPAEWPAPPPGLVFAEINRESGELATPATPAASRIVEYFMPGTEPIEIRSPWNVPRWGAVLPSCIPSVTVGC
ncbi:MAG: transglycosylase domain-containing protein [Gemmatimonadaceae bacterium]